MEVAPAGFEPFHAHRDADADSEPFQSDEAWRDVRFVKQAPLEKCGGLFADPLVWAEKRGDTGNHARPALAERHLEITWALALSSAFASSIGRTATLPFGAKRLQTIAIIVAAVIMPSPTASPVGRCAASAPPQLPRKDTTPVKVIEVISTRY